MALQPAAGARDRNPWEVDSNRRLRAQLAEVYRLWGYQEVDPPTIERLDTLEAGGAIAGREVVRLAADEPLGLRPELTASIARAACTRLADRPRPLRLWADGVTFRSSVAEGDGQRLHEAIQSGVELLGEPSAAADRELMQLLLAATATLGLRPEHQPTLLVGHHGLLDALLEPLPEAQRSVTRRALTDFDPLALAQLPLPEEQRQRLTALLTLRGEPASVLAELEQWIGRVPLLESLAATLAAVAPAAERQGVRLQLDPTFQPHFDLYDGLVLKLVCQGADAPVAIASGGRYDGLVRRFSADPDQAAGTGFGFAIEAIRDLLQQHAPQSQAPAPWLVASGKGDLEAVLGRMAELHQAGEAAELHGRPCNSEAEAEQLALLRGCRGAIWLAG
ncbi:ATP phosphoribosyltransferase regulatory subunit [Synechococcus sp. CBW1004]|uniref:ATP phosphoribosyltransferase regulatory subunit n=1 Tax=Synechococcus sp. CBW1004 TaxID=1353136 RepID=UPI0018CDE4CF|nr:ATP phosphoribosyltransferase regulatory subunit [Synechococcus sp. CBW1004]QPN63955.1 ATP phosphoribosyltransferase regulatory subunit [Synechococcus sp. CBW1004]